MCLFFMFGRNYRIGYVKLYRMKLELLQKGQVCISSWTFIFHVSEVLHNSMNNCYSLIQMYNDLKGWVAVIALTDSNLLKFTHKSYACEPVIFFHFCLLQKKLILTLSLPYLCSEFDHTDYITPSRAADFSWYCVYFFPLSSKQYFMNEFSL